MTKDPVSICVWCGSSMGTDVVYAEAMEEVGRLIAQAGATMVYGGGANGLMRVSAESALKHGGRVVGVYPKFFITNEPPYQELSELIYTDTMADRKTKMIEISDGFLTGPGGIGSLDELSEIHTENILLQVNKPFCLLNIAGYWNKLIDQYENMVQQGFLRADLFDLLKIFEAPETAVNYLLSARR